MTIFRILGEEFLKSVLTENEYKKLFLQEGTPPKSITVSLEYGLNNTKKCKVTRAGNSGHVYVPASWIGKTVTISVMD